ncbi:SigE family RNA polymerase sigma factor [Nocardioides daphniae]|uniref:DNA-directed RNA polymerase sigma-70 factor n=1 Tax=Nocardioides daphniae TaxID=402297 RepID=A0A4P7UGL6_9ACTN|nr:SigE family RNA polymerase sigma factor [Nocardioides daphniae]QCC78378.1 SigE family RNA polymerase sigma factor [Nocardioides daphniae]GGD13035.1 DNA-directed RNA polymerase sigma-70 factor [Nocardioides daphniae]
MLTADEAGFNEFVAARGPAFQRTAFLLTSDHHTAQDLVQQALLEAARRWEKIHTSPEAYVRRTIYTANVSRWRRLRFSEHELTGDRVADPGHDADARLTLMAALERLTTKQRAVIVLRYYEDLTETQAAEALGVSVGTVKSTHSQALRRLRDHAPHLAELLGRTP